MIFSLAVDLLTQCAFILEANFLIESSAAFIVFINEQSNLMQVHFIEGKSEQDAESIRSIAFPLRAGFQNDGKQRTSGSVIDFPELDGESVKVEYVS